MIYSKTSEKILDIFSELKATAAPGLGSFLRQSMSARFHEIQWRMLEKYWEENLKVILEIVRKNNLNLASCVEET